VKPPSVRLALGAALVAALFFAPQALAAPAATKLTLSGSSQAPGGKGTVTAKLTAPGGAMVEASGSVTPSAANPLVPKLAAVYVTSTTRPAGPDSVNVVFPDLDITPGTYTLEVRLADSVGRETSAATAQFTLALEPGPIAPPSMETVPTFGTVAGMQVMNPAALQSDIDFAPYRNGSIYYVVKNLAVHNRTFRPLTVVFSESDPRHYYWYARWKVKSDSYNEEGGLPCPATSNPAWSGQYDQPETWPSVAVSYAQSGATCLDGACRQIRFAARSQATVAVGMPGFSSLPASTMVLTQYGWVHAATQSTVVHAVQAIDTGMDCMSTGDCTTGTCLGTPGAKTCRYCQVTYRDLMLAITTVASETTGTINYAISMSDPASAVPWTSRAFNGFGFYITEDAVLP